MVHQYKNNGYNIVLDVNSGSVHVVDDVVYDVIPMVEEALSGGEPKEEYYSGTLRLAARVLFPLADGIVLQSRGSRKFFGPAVRKRL